MTAFDKSTNLPAGANTLERSLFLQCLAADFLYSKTTYPMNTDNRTQPVVTIQWGRDMENKLRAICTLHFEVNETIFTDTQTKPYTKANEWGSTAYPAAYSS